MIPLPIEARPGWVAGLAGAVGATAAAAVAVVSADELAVIVLQFSVLAVALLTVGVFAGSGRVVAAASLPFLVGAVVGLNRDEHWGPALVVGLLWYGASETAWISIETRIDGERSPAVGRLRTREVATVVVLAATIGLTAFALAGAAPTRTLLIKAVVVAGVLAGLTAASRPLAIRAKHGG